MSLSHKYIFFKVRGEETYTELFSLYYLCPLFPIVNEQKYQ